MKQALVLLILALFGITAFSAKCSIDSKAGASIKPNKPKTCYVGGCSGQLCTDNEGAISTCEWRDEYACYASATCERQTNGKCGWTNTSELKECLANPPSEPVTDKCYVGGCSSEVCSDDPNAVSPCIWREDFVCYRDAQCERQSDGQCGWTQTKDLEKCLDSHQAEPEPVPVIEAPAGDQCFVGGCSGELCTSEEGGMASICIWKEEFACYKDAKCERQADGGCGWTQTEELKDCLDSHPSELEPEPVTETPEDSGKCYVGGCSGEVCTSEEGGVAGICIWKDEFVCYKDAKCERQADGECGWTQTEELKDCLSNPPSNAV